MSKEKFYIFIDFDGVLNNSFTESVIKNWADGDHHGLDDLNGNELTKLYHALNVKWDVEIIVCSSWRNFYCLKQLKGFLGKYIPEDKIMDTTEVLDVYVTGMNDETRAEEVFNYVREKGIINWVVLDDDKSYNQWTDANRKHWINTQREIGLTAEDVNKYLEENGL